MRPHPSARPGALRLAVLAFLTAWSTRGADFKFPTQTLTVPDGFEVELVAGPPMVNRPIMADFDEQGRLYVADSSGATYAPKKQLVDKPHRMVRLEDTHGDGRFDKSQVFAEGLMFPEGVLCYDGAVYYSGVPSIWKLEDRDGDGMAETRTEWFQGKTMTGCANDLHGPYLGPDGYIYWCKGAFEAQTHERPGRPAVSDSAAHIFRCRPDGSDFDSVMSGGMDNPVEVAFSPAGEVFFTTTFYTNPDGGNRDALVHAIYGGVYPKVHGVIDGLKRTGPLMPAMTHLGPAAPCGLTRYTSRGFGPGYQDNLFSTQFNLHKIQRHILEPLGASYRTKDIDFLVSDNPDFHPTDVLEDADGSLLVIDTGGWYKVCCPTSQIAKPEVLGAIYRVRRSGAVKVVDPRGLKLDWAAWEKAKEAPSMTRLLKDAPSVASLLDDPRPAVQRRAVETLAKFGDDAVPALSAVLGPQSSPTARLNAVWTLTRIHTARSMESIRTAMADSDPTVREAAAYSAGLLRDAGSALLLLDILKSGSDHLKMAAATSLGQIEARVAVPELLDAAARPHDRSLEHSIIYALIEIHDTAATRRGLNAYSPAAKAAALTALDQMDGGGLRAEEALPGLNSENDEFRKTALWVVSHHDEWGAALSGFFEKRLAGGKTSPAEQAELGAELSQLARNESIQSLIGRLAAPSAATTPEIRLMLLGAMRDSNLESAPRSWADALLPILGGEDERALRVALEAARVLTREKSYQLALANALLSLGGNPARPDEIRLGAFAMLPAPMPVVMPGDFAFLTSRLASAGSPLDRGRAAEILGRSKMSVDQLTILAGLLRGAGPLELGKLLPAFEGATNEVIGAALVESLQQAKGRAAVRPDVLRPLLAKYSDETRARGEALLLSLNVDAGRQKRRLDDLEAGLDSGERNRGQAIFSGAKAACFTCHAIGYVGGHVGPDLSRVGSIRTRRDLLEAIVYPSASFARGYEPMIVTTRGGDEFSGILRDESGDSITVVSGPTASQRIARSNVTEIRPGTVSVMPEGFADQLNPREVADLIAFLKSLK